MDLDIADLFRSRFGRPAVRKMLGFTKLRKPTVEAVLRQSIKGKRGRRIFARVRVERVGAGYECWPTGEQGSGIMSSMAKADGLAIILEDRGGVAAGESRESGAGDRTLKEIVQEALRPLLREWLDEHLEVLIERQVRRELERLVRRAEDSAEKT